jgi:large subunit ribosomal protein L10
MILLKKKIGELVRDLVAADLKRRMDASADVLLVNFHKLSSADMTLLRKALKGTGASVLVTKNSYIRKALETLKKPAASIGLLEGPMALVFVKDDPIVVAKALADFAKTHEACSIRGGFFAQRVLSVEDVVRVAKLPGRKGLYQQVAGTLNAPMGKLAMGLNQIVAKLAYALAAVSDKKK